MGWLSVLAVATVALTGLPAQGREPGLPPAWSVPDSLSARWASVTALPDGEGWLLCGWDTVWRVEGPSSGRPLVRSVADGGFLRQPFNVAVAPRSLLVYDRETMNFIEADRASDKPVGSLVFTKAGGVPYTGSAWNGFRWVIAGFMKDATQALLEIQARDATSFAFVGVGWMGDAPGDWFSAAATIRNGRTPVAVLARPYAASGAKLATTLHGFQIPPGRVAKDTR